ncbi:MAG: cytosine deaminase [Pseudomonadota bacterium]
MDASVPTALLEFGEGDVTAVDITLDGPRIALVEPHADGATGEVDCKGGIVMPAFVDMHTHLDKGHIWPRAQNPDGTFNGALNATVDDWPNWTADELTARMTFALKAAYAHGTAAIRTHIDSRKGEPEATWPLFGSLREEWADKITLQAVSLQPIDDVEGNGSALFDQVAPYGGLVGAVLYPSPTTRQKLDALVRGAEDRGVDLDFHVDETLDPATNVLADVAAAAKDVGFSGTVTCGHCCSLMAMEEAKALAILDAVAEASLAIVSLPLCNHYLQDRRARRTPRIRGGTLVHEMAERGIRVAIASDNTRDPFYAYGDLDMAEVWREATRTLHLDHPLGDWPRAVTATPAAIMGLSDRDRLAAGAPADLVVFSARTPSELFARAQGDRRIIRGGRFIDAAPPAYGELDALWTSPR